MVNFTINLYHHGFFVGNPLHYMDGDLRVVHNVNFEGVIYSEFCHNLRKLVVMAPVSYYYVKSGVPMNLGLKPLKTDEDLEAFKKAAQENNSKIDIYCEHSGYNVLEMLKNDNLVNEEDEQDFSDNENQDTLDDVKDLVDFQTEDDSDVVIPKITTNDPWLNKLVGLGKFIGHMDDPIPPLNGRFMVEIDDPEEDEIDTQYKVKKGVQYPAFDPETPWNSCKPILGLRFESPAQLKQCLANYGVTHGYQLWYLQNDSHKLLVLCARDVSEGRCAGKRGKKDNESATCSTKGQGSKDCKGESSKISKATKERWDKKKEEEKKNVANQKDCKFRLWASWMSTERSFQIKTLYADHKCSRNYNLGSLVTYKWIAHHYAREIIDNPWLTYRYMQNSIREKFKIDVSLGQCKRAKQVALFDHEGGLVDHYSRL
ncbi:hypothetical protein CTI12_AA401760 [Artemisia annua]|uniref:PB1-like domain-containing protein n=1 Tax=Artemisia annua TaxID=35608 RepID=A0A2U1MAJ0_ARTAN|nr:hypothetical protein CTI12_AA401760 [Artemisia annua]